MGAIKMDDRCGFANRVGRKFDKFWQWKLPCPVDPFEDIYRASFNDEQWNAMKLLLDTKPGTMKEENSFNMYWADDHFVTFRFPHGIKLPSHGCHLDYLPQPVQRKVRTWVCSVNRFRVLRDELMRRCKGVMGNPTGEGKQYVKRRLANMDPRCNTPIQLYALWPEIHPMMCSEWKRDIQLMTNRKPRPPKLVGYRMIRGEPSHNRFVTPEQFRCEDKEATQYEKQSFKEINMILTMLSLADHVDDPKNYPTFNGDVTM